MDIIRHSGKRKDLKLEDFNGGDLATVATTGSYTDLINKPTIPPGQIQSDWNEVDNTKLDFIKNKPTGLTQIQSDWNETNNTLADYIKNKPTIPAVQIQSDWTQGNTVALDYIKNKPSIPATQLQSDWNETDSTKLDFILNKPTIPAAQIQADWTQASTGALDYIKHKPTLATVATTGSYSDLTGKPTIPSQFNPIAGTGISITGTYPNETFSVISPTSTSIPSLASLGILANGTDQTSAVQTILSNSAYAGVLIDFSSPAAVTINGTLNCNGKILRFNRGSYITGTGTVNNAILDIDYLSQGFGSGITLTNAKSARPYTSVMLFGAAGDGSTNDQPALQKVSDTVIANSTLPRTLIVPSLTFKITAPWIIYSWNGTDYQQCTINILGDPAVVNSNMIGYPKIDATSITTTFAIGVQIGYGVIIDGLYIQGAANIVGVSYDSFISNSFSAYSSTRDSPFSPYVGICDMPFTNLGSDIPSDGGYPGYNASAGLNWYRGSGTHRQSGSTGLTIRNCVIQGFTIDICQAPNGTTQQGEDMVIQHCELHYAKVAIAFCQTQTDNASIEDIKSWYYLWTFIDGTSYGGGKGYVPRVSRVNIAAFVNTAFSISSDKSFLLEKIYAESLFNIGFISSNSGIKVVACDFNFALNTDTYKQPQYHLQAINASFSGGSIRYFDGLFNKRIRISCQKLSFEATGFDLPPFIPNQPSAQQPNVYYQNCALGNNLMLGMKDDYYSMSTVRFLPVLYGNFKLKNGLGLYSYTYPSGNPIFPDITMSYDCTGFDRFVLNFAVSQTITPDSTRSATFTAAAPSLAQVGDYCFDNLTGNILGRISVISGSLITIVDIPNNISTATFANINLVYFLTTACPIIGDISGSNTITNVCQVFPGFSNTLVAGVRFDHPSFPKGTYVVSFSSNTITLSANCNKTATRQNFINGEPEVSVKCILAPSSSSLNTFTTPLPSGTVWKEEMTSSSTSTTQSNKWYFNQGGFLNATALSLSSAFQADFNIEPVYRVSGGSFQYFDNAGGTWNNA